MTFSLEFGSKLLQDFDEMWSSSFVSLVIDNLDDEGMDMMLDESDRLRCDASKGYRMDGLKTIWEMVEKRETEG